MEERQKPSGETQKEQRRSHFSNDPFEYVKILFRGEVSNAILEKLLKKRIPVYSDGVS